MLQTFNVPALGRIVNAKATFLRYESAGVDGADQALRVRVDGNDLGTYLPGDSIDLPVHGSTWEIVPVSGTQTAIVRLGVGRVSAARLLGTVNISNRLSTSIAWLETSLPLATGLNTSTLVIAPGAGNLRGFVFRQATIFVQGSATGAAEVRLITAPVVPATATPGNAYQFLSASAAPSASLTQKSGEQNITVPAGWGLWIVTNHTTAAVAAASASVGVEPL